MSVFAKCLKCNEDFVFYVERGFEKILKEGCFSCHSKNLKFKADDWEKYKLDFITDECPKCHQTKITDILNWEEIRGIVIKKGGIDNKEMFIDSMNRNIEVACYCVSTGFNWKSPWIIGGGLVGVGLIIGLIV